MLMVLCPCTTQCTAIPQGYPGNLSIVATYELLANADELRITITAVTDKPTPGKEPPKCTQQRRIQVHMSDLQKPHSLSCSDGC